MLKGPVSDHDMSTRRVAPQLATADRGRLHAVLAAGVAAKNVPQQVSGNARTVIDARALRRGYARFDVLVPPEHRELFFTHLFLWNLRDRAGERQWLDEEKIIAAYLPLREQLFEALETTTISREDILIRIRNPVFHGWFVVSETEGSDKVWDRIEPVMDEVVEQYFAGRITMEQAVSRFVKHALDTSPEA